MTAFIPKRGTKNHYDDFQKLSLPLSVNMSSTEIFTTFELQGAFSVCWNLRRMQSSLTRLSVTLNLHRSITKFHQTHTKTDVYFDCLKLESSSGALWGDLMPLRASCHSSITHAEVLSSSHCQLKCFIIFGMQTEE